MPTYTLRNKITEEVKEFQFPSHSWMSGFLKGNRDWENAFWLNRPNFVAGRGDGAKPDAGFKEVLSKIAENNPHTPMSDQHGSKSVTNVKVRDAVNKVRKKHGGAI